jgi:hypothetical protein
VASEFEHVIDIEMRVARERFFTRIGMLVLATLVFDAIAAVLAYLGERGARHGFANVWEALFWTTTQMLTVSSQLPNPVHTATKFLDVGLELWALVVVTALAGTFADVLHHRTRKHVRAAMKPPG